jgi:uncharacterized membrane protein YsdA (DUF1294 family)
MDIIYIYYFGFINTITALAFILDKVKSQLANSQRISELTFHTLEALGGCFSTFIFINLLNHKRAKLRYLLISYTILGTWIYFLYKYRYLWFN